MTIDEAIAHCLEVAEQEECFINYPHNDIVVDDLNIESRKRYAAEQRQLATWLKELKDLREFNCKIYDVLAKQFGSPCNLSDAVDRYMQENGRCADCGVEISDNICWSRYIQTKLTKDCEMSNDTANNMADIIHRLEKELKDLREERTVLTSACDRLIKEKGELLRKINNTTH